MKLSILTILTLVMFSLSANTVLAEGRGKEMREKFKNMSEEERKAFKEARKAEWAGLSKEEKLQKIEEMKAKKEAHWNSMSDDEKISAFEKKQKHKMKRKHKRKGKKGDDAGEE